MRNLFIYFRKSIVLRINIDIPFPMFLLFQGRCFYRDFAIALWIYKKRTEIISVLFPLCIRINRIKLLFICLDFLFIPNGTNIFAIDHTKQILTLADIFISCI